MKCNTKRRNTKSLSTMTTKFIQNIKSLIKRDRKSIPVFLNNKKRITTYHESEFIKLIRKEIVSKIDKNIILEFFKKNKNERTIQNIKAVADYLSLNEKFIFFWELREIGLDYLYILINYLQVEQYKQDDLIFDYQETLNKFYVILDGNITLYLPYFKKKEMTVKDFYEYITKIKEHDNHKFLRIERKNDIYHEEIALFKCNKYDKNCIKGKEDITKLFFIEEQIKADIMKPGNAINDLSMVYQLKQNFIGKASSNLLLGYISRADFYKIFKEILEKHFIIKFNLMKKFNFCFQNFTSHNLAQLTSYLIPLTCIRNDILYNQGDEADNFYIVEEGVYNMYIDIDINDVHNFEKYITNHEGNILQNISKIIKNKGGITKEEIYNLIKCGDRINGKFPLFKNREKNGLKKLLLKKTYDFYNNKINLIDLKMNEENLKHNNKILSIKICTFTKNDIIGVEDSMEMKKRLGNLVCISETGKLRYIRTFDMANFYATNQTLDVNNLLTYITQRCNTLLERVKKNYCKEKKENSRIISSLYDKVIHHSQNNSFSNRNKPNKRLNQSSSYIFDSNKINNLSNINIEKNIKNSSFYIKSFFNERQIKSAGRRLCKLRHSISRFKKENINLKNKSLKCSRINNTNNTNYKIRISPKKDKSNNCNTTNNMNLGQKLFRNTSIHKNTNNYMNNNNIINKKKKHYYISRLLFDEETEKLKEKELIKGRKEKNLFYLQNPLNICLNEYIKNKQMIKCMAKSKSNNKNSSLFNLMNEHNFSERKGKYLNNNNENKSKRHALKLSFKFEKQLQNFTGIYNVERTLKTNEQIFKNVPFLTKKYHIVSYLEQKQAYFQRHCEFKNKTNNNKYVNYYNNNDNNLNNPNNFNNKIYENNSYNISSSIQNIQNIRYNYNNEENNINYNYIKKHKNKESKLLTSNSKNKINVLSLKENNKLSPDVEKVDKGTSTNLSRYNYYTYFDKVDNSTNNYSLNNNHYNKPLTSRRTHKYKI